MPTTARNGGKYENHRNIKGLRFSVAPMMDWTDVV